MYNLYILQQIIIGKYMKVYLKKINQKLLVFSEDFLREFTDQLSENDAIYLQDLNSNPVSHPFSWFSSYDFYQYIMNLIKVDNNEANNLLIIYQIKLNYYIVSVINIQTEEYNSLQWSSMWIDTNEKLSQLENKLVANPEVLKLAFKVYFDVVPQLHDKNNYYKESTQDNYLRALDMVDKKLGIPIFSSFSKVNTDEMVNELKLMNEEKDNEVFNKINNHNTLTAAIRTYTDFFNNWLANGRLDLNTIDDNNAKSSYIVFAYQINDSKLTGLVKIGQVTFSLALASDIALTDDNHLFAYLAAQEIVKQYHISGNDVKILYSTIATKKDGSSFDVNDVDKWLEKNNYLRENFPNNFVGWYRLNINQIKRAINAIKNQEDYCDIDTEINLSANENNAIKNTFSWWEKQNRFFWINAEINNVIIPTFFLIKKSMQINSLKFNHVLILDSNLKDKNGWFEQFNNVKLDVHGYSFYSELNNEEDIRYNKANLNDDNKFIWILDFSSIANHEKYISTCIWDLIVINQLDKNITTELENAISRNSPNSKWLYFSDSIPFFS